MDEFEETLNRVLSDPEELSRLSRLAGELLGGGEKGQGGGAGAGLLQKLTGEAAGGDDKLKLVEALAPYLDPERRDRLRRAARLAKTARIAGKVMEQFGGEDLV